jgi:hypothetical protein
MMGPALGSDAYLDAFMNGFEFVLLAMRGRIQEADIPVDERARLEAFLADYMRISKAYHDRTPAPARKGLTIDGRMPVDVVPAMVN